MNMLEAILYSLEKNTHKISPTFSGSSGILEAHTGIRNPKLRTPLIWSKGEVRGLIIYSIKYTN